MRRAVVLALVLATGCKDKKQAPPPAAQVEPAKPPAIPAKPQGLPAACVDYIIAVEKLKKCEAPAKAAVMTQFEADSGALSGEKPIAREALEALCSERGPAAKRVVETACAAPVDVPALKAQVGKLDATIAAESKLASDASKPAAVRNEAKGKVAAAQQQKAELSAQIREAECRADPSRAGC